MDWIVNSECHGSNGYRLSSVRRLRQETDISGPNRVREKQIAIQVRIYPDVFRIDLRSLVIPHLRRTVP